VIYPDSSYVTFCPTYCQTTSSSSTIENLLNNAVQAWLTPVYGCTDPLALNYDSTATNDDGSCDYTSYTIKTIGSAFSPDTIICDLGDTINFILGGYHNAVEVSNSTCS
jgi:plastocyanin